MNEPGHAPAHVLVRVWLPDRPGALGLVASRIGAVRGDIVGVDVLERGGDVAVDEFAVELPSPDIASLLVDEIEEVDGASVEELRVVSHFPDPRTDALDSAAGLCESTDVPALHRLLVGHTRHEFLADFVALLRHRCVVESSGEVGLPPAQLAALVEGTAASPTVARGETGPEDLAIAAIPRHDAVMLVGRTGRPFRRRERAQLLALARIADRVWSLLPSPAA